MTIKETSAWLNVPPSWIYQRAFRGASDPIPFIKLGRLLRFETARLVRWIEERQIVGRA